jgi:arabinose-5-phosphate isomerase
MEYLDIAKTVLELEAKSIQEASQKLVPEQIENLVQIFKSLNNSRGSLIFCGVGKSGYIGQKLASTFCSLGLPSYFLHPIEALHGDIGRISSSDCIVFISNSGTTEEIIKLMPFVIINKEQRIGLIGNINSPIAANCNLVFDCSVEKEACKNNQAPTTSSTLALAVGDAMAVVYEYLVGLSKEGFAYNHPGGLLGKSLRIKVKDILVDIFNSPILSPTSSIREAVLEMTKFPIGGCAIVENGKLLGILVDGDIRRFLTQKNPDLDRKISEVMTQNPITTTSEALAIDALYVMENRQSQIGILPVIGKDREFLGFIRLHDILREGISLKAKSENLSV